MNIKKTLLAALVALGCVSASAQEAKVEYEYVPNWYVQGQIGGQYTLGEVDFSDLLSPTAQIAVGYNFNKVVGARLGINAWQSKGGSEIFCNTYKWKWNYVAPHVDATFNLTNLFCDYNPERLVNVGVFAGLGANIAFSNDEAAKADAAMSAAHPIKDLSGTLAESQYLRYLWDGSKARLLANIGANVDFRINEKLTAGVEISATTLGDHYNSKKAGNTDWYFNAMAGVKYTFGDTYKKKIAEPVVARPVESTPAPVQTNRVERVETPKATNKIETVEPIRENIFFLIRSTSVAIDQQPKVKRIAEHMKKFPNTKVSITGYADKGTGNATINMNLSKKRAQIVKEELVKNYGIDESRIITDAKGDTVQPFEKETDNRVSICIVE